MTAFWQLQTVYDEYFKKYWHVIQPFMPEHKRCWLLTNYHHHTTTVLRPFFRDHPGEPVPEEYFWTSWYKERLPEADTPTIRLGATPSGLTSHLHHPPFFTGQMPFLPPNQQCQSTEGNYYLLINAKITNNEMRWVNHYLSTKSWEKETKRHF